MEHVAACAVSPGMISFSAVLLQLVAIGFVHAHDTGKPFVTVVRTDGFGAQLQERITCLVKSRVTPGLSYVHTPMRNLDHLRSASWRVFHALEEFVNLGEGELRPEDVPADQIEILEGCAGFVNANIGLLELFTGELFWKQQSNKECPQQRIPHFHLDSGNSRKLSVHVHVRRGDVQRDNKDKWLDMSHHLKNVHKVSEAAKLVDMSAEIHVHSQGNTSEFTQLVEKYEATLHLDVEMMASWKAMTEADVLIMSRSSFSYTAALYNQAGIIIYSDMRPSEPLPSWLEDSASVNAIAMRLQHFKVLRRLGSLT